MNKNATQYTPNRQTIVKKYKFRHQKPIDIEKGHRTLNIASMNTDSVRNAEARFTLTRTLTTLNIDVSCIQETHNERIDAATSGDYAILRGGCNTKNQQTTKNRKNIKKRQKLLKRWRLICNQNEHRKLQNISRINVIIVGITIKAAKLTNNLSILNTYAIDRNYEFREIKERWGAMDYYFRDQSRNLIKRRRTYNNGEPMRTNDNIKYNGNRQIGNKQHNINGLHLAAKCGLIEYVSGNALISPDMETKKIAQHGIAAMIEYVNGRFFAIRAKYRNWVANISKSNITNPRQFYATQ